MFKKQQVGYDKTIDRKRSFAKTMVTGAAFIIVASALMRGTGYPVYEHGIFMLASILFAVTIMQWEAGRDGGGNRFILIWTGSLAVVAVASVAWSLEPILSISSAFIYIAYALFSFSCFRIGQIFEGAWSNTVLPMLLTVVFAGTIVALTGIIGYAATAYPWAMVVDGMLMASSSLEYPNGLAVYVLMTLAPTLYVWGLATGRSRLLAAIAAAIQFAAIGLSFSKTGIVFLVLLAVYLVARSRTQGYRKKRYLYAGLCLIVLFLLPYAATLAGGYDFAGWATRDVTFDSIVSHRFATWEGSIDAWLDRPWMGWGAGVFDTVFPGYALDSAPRHAHNIFLHAAVEFGLIGLVSFIILYVYGFRLIHRSFFTSRNEGDNDLRRALSFSCLVFLTVNLWDFTFYIPAITILFIVLFAMLGGGETRPATPPTS